MRLFTPTIVLCLAAVAGSQLVIAAAQTGSSVNKGEDGIAVKGYDVVAYFDQKRPMKADPQYSYQYNGAKYNFVSSEHLDLFAKNPESYLLNTGGIARLALRWATKRISTLNPGPSLMGSCT